MKHIEIDEELYQYIASNTQFIGESASSILRRLLSLPLIEAEVQQKNINIIESPSIAENIQKISSEDSATKIVAEEPSVIIAPSESVFNYINKEELAMQRGVVGRFLLLLSALHRVHPSNFSVVQDIRGKGRLYFATSEEELAQSGSSTKPRQIPESAYWVMTNSNTTRKKMMITEVTKALGYSESDIEKIRDLL